jgi:hypothetical protein
MTLVHTDSRRRVSLGKVLEANRDYRVSVSTHGTITLEPVTTISDYERSILADVVLSTQLEAAAAAVDRGDVVPVKRRERRATTAA